MCLGVFALLALVLPVLLLATLVRALAAYGPVGMVLAAGVVVGAALTLRMLGRLLGRWWRSTKADDRV